MTEQLTFDTVTRHLEKDALAVDFRWSILVAAAWSYRHDSVLRPFPPMLLRRSDSDSGIESAPVNVENIPLENRDYAAVVSIHVTRVIFDI